MEMPKLKTKSFAAAPEQVKVWKARLVETGPAVTLIRVPISSTSVDRDGDEFSMDGLESMLAALKTGKIPYFLDHGYTDTGVRNYGALDMIGAWLDGEVEGNVLYGTAFIEPGNWRGEELARKLEMGMPIGHSVGFGHIKGRDRPGGGLIFDEVSLWEVSAVGIPSNPDAVNSAAVAAVVKSLRVKAGLEKEMKRKTKEGEEEPNEEEKREEEEQEGEKQPESCEEEGEEKKQPEGEPTEDEDEGEEEKSYEVLDEAGLRELVADEVGKQLAPIHEALKRLDTLDEIKTALTKTVAARSKGPRGIVVVRETPESQKNPEPTASPYKPLY